MKIIPVAKTIQKSVPKITPKQPKPLISSKPPKTPAADLDLSFEEQGFFKLGNRIIPIVFPR